MSRSRGRAITSRTASGVTSWKTTRRTALPSSAPRSRSQTSTCQAIASPSRSGSVASTSTSASSSAAAILPSARVALRFVAYTMAKSRAGSTEPSFAARSRTWPRVAMTSWPEPR